MSASFNMNKYKRRASQAGEAINILRNPSISVEPGSLQHVQIAAIVAAQSKSGDKLQKTASKSIEDKLTALTWSQRVAANKRAILSFVALIILVGTVGLVLMSKSKPDREKGGSEIFPPPPDVEKLPSNNCSAFSKAGNSKDGSLVTVQGRLTFLAHERSYPNLLFNNSEMIQLICDDASAEKLRPLANQYVKVTGKKFACSLLMPNGSRAIPVKDPTATATATTTSNPTNIPEFSPGPRNLALVFFYFQDDNSVPSNDPQSLADNIFDPQMGMNALFYNASYGMLNFTGLSSPNADVYGYIKIPMKSKDGCNFWDWTMKALELAKFNYTPYDHIMFVTQPKSGICDFGGIAELYGWWSMVITQYFQIEGAQTHEMGHNIGFNHAGGLTCFKGSKVFGDIKSCTSYEYGDRFETMSGGSRNHINAFHREELGWFIKGNVLEVSKDGNFTINSLDGLSNTVGALALKIPLLVPYTLTRNYQGASYKDIMAYYYLELTHGVTYDKPSYGAVKKTNGVYIRLAPNPARFQSETYAYAINTDLILPGDWFSDPKQNLTITLIDIDEYQASLSIKIGS